MFFSDLRLPDEKRILQDFGTLVKTALFLLLILCGCATKQRPVADPDAEQFAREKDKFVTVYLSGDVKAHGQRLIRRGLSRTNILEAAEGFAGLSFVKPRWVTIRRGPETCKVQFTDMGRGKWKQFLIDEGDKVIVETLYF